MQKLLAYATSVARRRHIKNTDRIRKSELSRQSMSLASVASILAALLAYLPLTAGKSLAAPKSMSTTLVTAKASPAKYVLLGKVKLNSFYCARSENGTLTPYRVRSIKKGKIKATLVKAGKDGITKKQLKSVLGKCQKQLLKNAARCVPQAISNELSFGENLAGPITLQGVDQCGAPLSFHLLSMPSEGTLSGSAPHLTYQPRFNSSELTFKVSNGLAESAPARIGLNVMSSDAPMRGNANDLQPYAERINEQEIRHLLDKVALGGDESLVAYGLQYGLTPLVDLLIQSSSPDVDVRARNIARRYQDLYCVTLSVPDGNGMPTNVSYCNDPNIDGRPLVNARSEAISWLHNMRYGNGLREKLALLWHDHFAINLAANPFGENARRRYIEQHVALLRAFALDRSPTSALESSFLGFARGMHRDGAMNAWLDNYLNTFSAANENYGREVSELFLIGQNDPISGARNYSENDILQVTRAFAGWVENAVQYQEELFEMIPQTAGFPNRFVNPFFVNFVDFNEGRWMPNPFNPQSIRIFAGAPWEANEPFDSDSLTSHILNRHHGSARYLSAKLYAQLVQPNPSEAVVSQLAQRWTASGFRVSVIARDLMRSSAMFSHQAQDACIIAPLEHMVSFSKKLNLPTVSADNSFDLYDTVRAQSGNAGDILLQKPTVFGTKGCGVNRDGNIAYGQVWLNPVNVLNRRNGFVNLINTIQSNRARVGFEYTSLLPAGDAARDPAMVVQHIARKLNVTLSPSELSRAAQYMTSVITTSGGPEVGIRWEPTNTNLINTKIPGLLEILESHPSAWRN